jgi:hypothetical protein
MLFLANLLTGSRLLMAGILIYVIPAGMWSLALALTVYGLLSDAIDGEVARSPERKDPTRRPSEKRKKFGMWFDGIADALFALSLIVGLVVQGLLPWWVGVAMVVAVATIWVWVGKIPPDSPWWFIRRHVHYLHPLVSIVFLAYTVGVMTWLAVDNDQMLKGLYIIYCCGGVMLAFFKRQRIIDIIHGPKLG